MIEAQIPIEIDGKGGGYGKAEGISAREVAKRFSLIVETPHARSVSTILRVAREQRMARDPLLERSQFMMMLGALAVVVLAVVPFTTPEHRTKLFFFAGTLGLFLLISGAWMFSKRNELKAVRMQINEIERLAYESLKIVVENPEFKPRELTREEEHTLKHLRRFGTLPEALGLAKG